MTAQSGKPFDGSATGSLLVPFGLGNRPAKGVRDISNSGIEGRRTVWKPDFVDAAL